MPPFPPFPPLRRPDISIRLPSFPRKRESIGVCPEAIHAQWPSRQFAGHQTWLDSRFGGNDA
jgi:hypothetical protein